MGHENCEIIICDEPCTFARLYGSYHDSSTSTVLPSIGVLCVTKLSFGVSACLKSSFCGYIMYLDAISPFSAALSFFGRIVILGETLNNSETKQESWRRILLEEYRKSQSLVSGIRFIETASSFTPLGVLIHHEIYINGTTRPLLSSLTLMNDSTYGDQRVVYDGELFCRICRRLTL